MEMVYKALGLDKITMFVRVDRVEKKFMDRSGAFQH